MNKITKQNTMTVRDVADVFDKNKKGMTAREIANAIGVDYSTVTRTVQKLGIATLQYRLVSNNKTAVYNEPQITAIKQSIQHSARSDLKSVNNLSNITTEVERLQKIQEAWNILQDMTNEYKQRAELAEKEKAQLQIQFDENKEWRTIKWMEKQTGEHYNWRELKRASDKLGLNVKKVFDQNYGEVNAYHIDAWQMAYGDAITDNFDEEE